MGAQLKKLCSPILDIHAVPGPGPSSGLGTVMEGDDRGGALLLRLVQTPRGVPGQGCHPQE